MFEAQEGLSTEVPQKGEAFYSKHRKLGILDYRLSFVVTITSDHLLRQLS